MRPRLAAPRWCELSALLAVVALLTISACGRSGAIDSPPPVIVIGLDGADWSFIDRLIAQGEMPQLAQLIARGRSGLLTTQQPPLSPLLWTTMMTGRGPLEHRILDFTRFQPETGRREPITSDERQVPALWNMLSARGRTVAVFGLWATYPAESVNGMIVSDRLYSFQNPGDPPALGTVSPADQDAVVQAALGAAERSVDLAALRDYLPWLDADQLAQALSKSPGDLLPVAELRRVLVQTAVYDRLARHSLAQRHDDVTVIYIQGTDAIGHLFAPYVPPRQPAIDSVAFQRYSTVAAHYYAAIDALLGVYAQAAAMRGARLLLVSDHGFEWGERRPRQGGSDRAATAGRWHRDQGIWLMVGPGIGFQPRNTASSSVAQVCATILALSGAAPSAGIAGPPLGGIPEGEVAPIDDRASWRPARSLPSATVTDESAEQKLAELRALGYIGSNEPAQRDARSRHAEPTRTAGSFNNEGLIWRQQGDVERARRAFEAALMVDSAHAASAWNLSELLFSSGQEGLRSDELLLTALAQGLPDGVEAVAHRAQSLLNGGDRLRARALLDRAMASGATSSALSLQRARARTEAGDCSGALSDARTATRLSPGESMAHAAVGLALLCQGREAEARLAFKRSLELDPAQPRLRQLLGLPGQ